jgi:hypothetical protein
MIILRRGDNLPTVAVLQSYLNQQPAVTEYLETDGNFGPKTEGAVLSFSGKPFVDYWTWQMTVGGNWQIIDSVDRTEYHDPKHAINDHKDLAPYRQTLLEQFGMSFGSPVVVDQVKASGRAGQVVLLRFHGHGSPGHMYLASGRDHSGSSFHYLYNKKFYESLRPLREIFAPFGSVELHGCNVGRGRPGRVLMSGMADALGVPVSAGLGTQYGGSKKTFRFESPTITYCPNGESLKAWSQRVGSASEPGPGQWQIR